MLPVPVQIPPERVPPIAKEVSSTKQTWMILFWFVSALALILGLGWQGHDASERFMGATFWFVVSFALGLKHYKIMRCANRALERAADPTVTWTLAGRDLLAYTDRGVSVPDASFKLSHGQVTMLTALPSATLRQ
jgi:hypothetical protein